LNKFPLRIRELRLEREMTQEDVGNIVGKAKSAISNWEQGIREPDNETLMILAEYFSVTIDWLLGRSDYRQGRIVTNGELLSFLPADVVERNKAVFYPPAIEDFSQIIFHACPVRRRGKISFIFTGTNTLTAF